MSTGGSAETRWDVWLTELQEEFNRAYGVDVALPREVCGVLSRAGQSVFSAERTLRTPDAQLRIAFRSYIKPYLKLIYMTIANSPATAPRPPRRATRRESLQLTESALKRGMDTLLFVDKATNVPFANVKAEVLDHLGVPHSLPRRRCRIPWKRLAEEWQERTPYLSAAPAAIKKRWARARGDRHVYGAYLERRAEELESMSRQVQEAAPFLLSAAWLWAFLNRVPDWPEQIEKRCGRERTLVISFMMAVGAAFVRANPQEVKQEGFVAAMHQLEAMSPTEVRRMWRRMLRDIDTMLAGQDLETSDHCAPSE
jgi:hypothetical protein